MDAKYGYCSHCGRAVTTEDARFCPICGAPLGGAQSGSEDTLSIHIPHLYPLTTEPSRRATHEVAEPPGNQTFATSGAEAIQKEIPPAMQTPSYQSAHQTSVASEDAPWLNHIPPEPPIRPGDISLSDDSNPMFGMGGNAYTAKNKIRPSTIFMALAAVVLLVVFIFVALPALLEKDKEATGDGNSATVRLATSSPEDSNTKADNRPDGVQSFPLLKAYDIPAHAQINLLFAEGLTPVLDKTSGKMGYLNKQGQLAIPCQYSEARSFNRDGTAVVIAADNVNNNTYRYSYIDTMGRVIRRSYNSNFYVDHQTLMTANPPGTAERATIKTRSDGQQPKDMYNFDPSDELAKRFGTSVVPVGSKSSPWQMAYLGDTFVQIAWSYTYGGRGVGLYDRYFGRLVHVEENAFPGDCYEYDPINHHIIFTSTRSGRPVKTYFSNDINKRYSTDVNNIADLSSYPDLSRNYWCVKGSSGSYESIQWNSAYIVNSLEGKYPDAPAGSGLKAAYLNCDFQMIEFNSPFRPLRNPGCSFTPVDGILSVTDGNDAWYMTLDGAQVGGQMYSQAYPFSPHGLAYVVTKEGAGQYIDRTGALVMNLGGNTGSMFFDDGYAIVRTEDGREGVIDGEGNWLILPQNQYQFIGVNSILLDEVALSENNAA